MERRKGQRIRVPQGRRKKSFKSYRKTKILQTGGCFKEDGGINSKIRGQGSSEEQTRKNILLDKGA